MNMTDYLTSNYINAESIASDVRIEATIASVRSREFEEKGEVKVKPVVYLDTGEGVVLNQTRLRRLVAAYGPNSDNWIGKTIVISRGSTLYEGKTVPAVHIDPIVAPRVAAEPRPRLVTVESGKGAPAEKAPVYAERSPPPISVIDDDIPF